MPLRSVTCSTCSTSVVHEGDHDGENNRMLRNVRGSSHDGPLVTRRSLPPWQSGKRRRAAWALPFLISEGFGHALIGDPLGWK
jgi:hypothetical protein